MKKWLKNAKSARTCTTQHTQNTATLNLCPKITVQTEQLIGFCLVVLRCRNL